MDPSRGLIATIAPPSAAHCLLLCASWMPYLSAFWAASWSPVSRVRRTVWPDCGCVASVCRLRGRPSESTRTRAVPGTPNRYVLNFPSTPDWPTSSPGW